VFNNSFGAALTRSSPADRRLPASNIHTLAAARSGLGRTTYASWRRGRVDLNILLAAVCRGMDHLSSRALRAVPDQRSTGESFSIPVCGEVPFLRAEIPCFALFALPPHGAMLRASVAVRTQSWDRFR